MRFRFQSVIPKMGLGKISLFFHLALTFYVIRCSYCEELEDTEAQDLFIIDGKVEVLSTNSKDWMTRSKVLVDGGDSVGYLRSDGSFSIYGLPSGSYVVEVSHPEYVFDAFRVDISTKGRKRARKVNYLQPSNVKNSPYPLEIKERMKARYFQQREQWRLTDFLFNPMVLTMVLPLLLIGVLPKMMNAADPEAQKEMQNQMKAINEKSTMPDISEMLVKYLGGGPTENKKTKKKSRT